MPLSWEDDEPDQNELDFFPDARDAILAGQLERDGEVRDDTSPRGDFPSRLTQKDILEEQCLDDVCQTIIFTQVGRS